MNSLFGTPDSVNVLFGCNWTTIWTYSLFAISSSGSKSFLSPFSQISDHLPGLHFLDFSPLVDVEVSVASCSPFATPLHLSKDSFAPNDSFAPFLLYFFWNFCPVNSEEQSLSFLVWYFFASRRFSRHMPWRYVWMPWWLRTAELLSPWAGRKRIYVLQIIRCQRSCSWEWQLWVYFPAPKSHLYWVSESLRHNLSFPPFHFGSACPSYS